MGKDNIKYIKYRNLFSILAALLFGLVIIISFCGLYSMTFTAFANTNSYKEYDFEDDSVIILMRENVSLGNALDSFYNLEIKNIIKLSDSLNSNIYKIEFKFNDKDKVLQAVNQLKDNCLIKEVSPNYLGNFNSTVDDASSNVQWGLYGTYGIQINNAWNISKGSREVRIGIIDTGVSAHKDLVDNLVLGWNFVDNNTNTEDIFGHGTHVAGIIGANGENSIGLMGVNKFVSIVPLKISDTDSWPTSLVINAINYAQNLWGTTDQIDILNFSGCNFPESESLRKAIDDYSGLFVCIASNNSENMDSIPNYPASFSIDNKITVGSIDINGNKSSFSNYGKLSVDIFAPGGSIYSTLPNNKYGFMSGTSMAAPHVAGVAALILSKYPNLTAMQLKSAILNSVDKSDNLIDFCVTGGRLNAYNALTSLHRHKYDNDYVWVDTAHHVASCECGATRTEGHAVSANQNSSLTRFKLCLFCGGRADYGFVRWEPNSNGITFITAKGSFILPNGVAVLVDEDIQSYIDGTIKFYNKNSVKE